ncbi:MAG: SRPBCC family protein [Candidatus Dormibacteria bacterium]
MRTMRQQITIAAPVERIWQAVHVDIKKVPRWSKSLVRTEVVGGGRLRVGSELLYVVRLPMGRTVDLHLLVAEYDEYTHCAGSLDSAVMRGRWGWRYRTHGDRTTVVYETAVELKGMLRFAGRALEQQVLNDVRGNLQALKEYVAGGLTTSAR